MATTETRYPDCLPAAWLGERLATSPGGIEAMRRSGELLGVRPEGSLEWLYPAWQFEDWKPRPGITRIVAAARAAGLDEARLYDLMTAPLGLSGRDRRRLVDLLLEGREDEIVDAVRAA